MAKEAHVLTSCGLIERKKTFDSFQAGDLLVFFHLSRVITVSDWSKGIGIDRKLPFFRQVVVGALFVSQTSGQRQCVRRVVRGVDTAIT